MPEEDARTLLGRARSELARGEHATAYQSFTRVASAFAGPDKLLGGGHAWRGLAQIALIEGEVEHGRRALDNAEALYAAGEGMLVGGAEAAEALRLDLLEGRATCLLLRADTELRSGSLAAARRAMVAARPLYQELGDRPSVSDLWTTTARVAEREGRWSRARFAWERAMEVRRANHDEIGTCDAQIRLVEALLADGDLEAVDEPLADAERRARELELPVLVGRVRVASARRLELAHDWEGAWERWLDALSILEQADPILRGLSRIRMARTAARVRREEVHELLQRGLASLLEGHYPDAVGLVLHQLAVVGLATGSPGLALLAAVGATEARESTDPLVEGVLFRALLQLDEHEAAWCLARLRHHRHPEGGHEATAVWLEERLADDFQRPADDAESLSTCLDALLLEIVLPLARAQGLPVEELGTRRAVSLLTRPPDPTLDPHAPSRSEEAVQPVLTWMIREDEIERHPLSEGTNLLGRGGDNVVRMAWDGKASRTHCALDYQGGRELYVTDLGSSHGVFLDGQRVEGSAKITDQTSLLIGETEFTLVWTVAGPRAAVAVPA